jgi:hypothetical protein
MRTQSTTKRVRPMARFLALTIAIAATALVATIPEASAQAPRLTEVDEAGFGIAAATPASCPGAGAPVCAAGDACMCITLTVPVAPAKPSASPPHKEQTVRARDEGTLAETISVDLTLSSPNGAGGSCYPWNGIGLLSVRDSTITLPQHGRICEVGASAVRLSGEGTYDLEQGTQRLANANGQGILAFTIQPASGTATAQVASQPEDSDETVIIQTVFSILCPVCGALWAS